MSVLTQKRSLKVFKDDMVFFGMNKISTLTHFWRFVFRFDCSFPLKANVGLRCLRHATCTDLTVENLFLREKYENRFQVEVKTTSSEQALQPQGQ